MVIATPICSVYLNGAPSDPDINYKNQDLDLGDPVIGRKLFFLPWNGCLVATRSICKGITGQQLADFGFVEGKAIVIDGRRYLCRCPRLGDEKSGNSEWDNIVNFYGGVKTSFWNPNDRSWTQKFSSDRRLQFACSGFRAVDRSVLPPGDHSPTLGFRPILEPLDSLWVDESHVGKKIRFFGTGGSVSGVLSQADDYDFVLDLGPDNAEIMDRDLNSLPWVSLTGDWMALVDRKAVVYASPLD